MMKKSIRQVLISFVVSASIVSCGQQKDSYEVGDYYNFNGDKGVVVEVNDTKQHGTIMSLESYHTSGDDANGVSTEIGDGWYVPSIEELVNMYNNLGVINKTLEEKGEHITIEFIWSSTIENGNMLCLKSTDGSIERNIPSSSNTGYARFFKKF